jgi:PAS domain S-box-containing protein
MSRETLQPVNESMRRLRAAFDVVARLAAAFSVADVAAALADQLDLAVAHDRAWLVTTAGSAGDTALSWSPRSRVDAARETATRAVLAALDGSETGPRKARVARRAAIVVPIRHHGATVGALALARKAALDEAEAEALALVGEPIAAAVVAAVRSDEGERKRRELADIIEIGRSFAAFADERSLCGAVAERAARLVGATVGFVATYDPASKSYVAQVPAYNAPVDEIGVFTLPLTSSDDSSDAIRWIEPFYSNDPASDRRFAPLLSDAFRPESVLCAPMRAKGETVGFIIAANRPGGFDHKSSRLFGAIAPQAAAALSNAHVIETAQKRAQREMLLNRITTAVHESLELDEVLDTTVRVLGQSLDLCRCYVAFVDKQRRMVRVVYEYHVPVVSSTAGEFPIGVYGGDLLTKMESGEIFAVDDVASDPRVDPFRDKILTPLAVQSLMYVPVRQDNRLAAVIGFSQCRARRRWTEEEIELAKTVAHQVGVAMRQAQLYDQQRRSAQYRALLNRINLLVRASLDLDTLLETTVDALGSVLEVDRCFVLAPGPFPPTLESALVRFEFCRTGVTSVRGLKMPIRNRAREGPVGTIEEPLAIADIAENPRLVSHRKADLLSLTETRAIISVRAIYADQVLAVLELNQCFEPRQWTDEEIDLVGEVAAQLAVGIHNALLFRRVTTSEQQWNTTFNSMMDGVALLDTNGVVLRLNESLLRVCNLDDAREALGRHCYELLYGDSESLREGPIERVLSTGQRIVVERDIAATGISLRESIDPIVDDQQQIVGLVLVVRDVTRERDAERAIRYRNRQLAALNAIAAATIHAQDLQSIWEGAFARIVDVTGSDAGAMLVLNEDEAALDPVATLGGAARIARLFDRAPDSPLMSAVLAADMPLALDEVPATDGASPVDAEAIDRAGIRSAIYTPIRSQRRVVGALVLAHASPRQYSANERQLLTVAGQQIGAAIENARLIATLQQALDRVREANRLKDEFLAVVSHELRTPLTAIQGWAEVLSDPDTSEAERDDGLTAIQQASESLTKLISDLLEMSRIETRMLRLELQHVDPNYPVLAAIQTVRQIAESKGVAITANLGSGIPSVVADSSRLQQVFWNLLVNAIKFTPAGGSVWVTTDAAGPGRVRIQVCDTGIGIDGSFMPHVFERFRQADSSTTRQYGGLGIGLSLVKSLVEAHNGTVTAESPGPGRGSTFTVVLPTVVPD